MWLLQANAPKPFFTRPARIAPHIMGGKGSILLVDDALHISLGSVILNATAVRAGATYKVAAGEFTWLSNDGLCSGFNTEDFNNGGLAATGSGIGTIITLIPNTDPFPSNIYVEDEDL